MLGTAVFGLVREPNLPAAAVYRQPMDRSGTATRKLRRTHEDQSEHVRRSIPHYAPNFYPPARSCFLLSSFPFCASFRSSFIGPLRKKFHFVCVKNGPTTSTGCSCYGALASRSVSREAGGTEEAFAVALLVNGNCAFMISRGCAVC